LAVVVNKSQVWVFAVKM
jgi:hypothetical protein